MPKPRTNMGVKPWPVDRSGVHGIILHYHVPPNHNGLADNDRPMNDTWRDNV
jgi:hypothetical protein